MLRGLFGPKQPSSKAAQFCIALINRTRIEAGHEGEKQVLPVVYATHYEFIGSLLGLIDFMVSQLNDPHPTGAVVRQVIEVLFGVNAPTAMATIQGGADNIILTGALAKAQKHLEWVGTRPRAETEIHLMFLKRFF